MLLSERDRQDQWVCDLAKKYGTERAALLPILQEFQAQFSYIDGHTMQVIADILNLHPVEVYSVTSFYSMLNMEPAGKFVIKLCRTTSCDMLGKDAVARQLENDLGIRFGETTRDGMFSLGWTSCMGLCDQGPAMLINDRTYAPVSPQDVHSILEECRRKYSVHALMQE